MKSNDALRVATSANRQFFALESEGITYICIQVKDNSLTNYTMTDVLIK